VFSSTITLPTWLVVLISILSILAAIDHFLLPGARWYFRRRLSRAIDDLNSRLKLRIQPLKIAKRQALIDQLTFDPDVLRACEDYAKANQTTREMALSQAKRYAKEIVPSFSAYAYFGIGTQLARWISTVLYRVRLGFMDEAALRAIDPDSSVIFVINHRSNMDYVLVTYMAAGSSALSYAVGEWARVWLLQNLIRSMGAYFVRRDSRDPLYRKVLSRYVQMAISGGLTQAVFPEGGLTRDGRLRAPKLGLISYMVSGFDPNGGRDAVFIPVGLNYDRVLEDRVQTGQLAVAPGEKSSGRFKLATFLRHFCSHIGLRLQGRWRRFGYACVSFGTPISLRAYLSSRGIDFRTLGAEQRQAEIDRLGQMLMAQVGKVVPVLPVALVSTALIEADAPLSSLELKARVLDLLNRLAARGAHVHIPRQDQDYAIEVGLRMLSLRHLIDQTDGLYQINPAETVLLCYYANSIVHLLDDAPPVTSANE
jgi:glycerol-3-phosphate O-acyltransferase